MVQLGGGGGGVDHDGLLLFETQASRSRHLAQKPLFDQRIVLAQQQPWCAVQVRDLYFQCF